jgi:hypothetical protein
MSCNEPQTAPAEIEKADIPYRKRLFTMYALSFIAVMCFVVIGIPKLIHHLKGLDYQGLFNTLEIITTLFLFSFIAPGIYCIVVGNRILHSKRMPYPGQKVIVDTKILNGKKAILRGRLLLWLGIVSICLTVFGEIRSHVIFEKFRHLDPFAAFRKNQGL